MGAHGDAVLTQVVSSKGLHRPGMLVIAVRSLRNKRDLIKLVDIQTMEGRSPIILSSSGGLAWGGHGVVCIISRAQMRFTSIVPLAAAVLDSCILRPASVFLFAILTLV